MKNLFFLVHFSMPVFFFPTFFVCFFHFHNTVVCASFEIIFVRSTSTQHYLDVCSIYLRTLRNITHTHTNAPIPGHGRPSGIPAAMDLLIQRPLSGPGCSGHAPRRSLGSPRSRPAPHQRRRWKLLHCWCPRLGRKRTTKGALLSSAVEVRQRDGVQGKVQRGVYSPCSYGGFPAVAGGGGGWGRGVKFAPTGYIDLYFFD